MVRSTIEKKEIQDRLAEIIQEVAKIKVVEPDKSLFGKEYNLSAELCVYILLKLKDNFNVVIDDKFVKSLNNYSLNDIVDAIINYSVL